MKTAAKADHFTQGYGGQYSVQLMVWDHSRHKWTETHAPPVKSMSEAMTILQHWTTHLPDLAPARYGVRETNSQGVVQAVREYGKGMAK
jgi:hypothetical protein